MSEKIHVEFCTDIYGDGSGGIYKIIREMNFRPCFGDLVFIWDLSDDPFVVERIVLEFPDDNDEHRNGIVAWLKAPVFINEVFDKSRVVYPKRRWTE